MKKVLIVGAGAVGAQIVSHALAKDLPYDFSLVDVDQELESAQILDLKDAATVCEYARVDGCDYGGECMLAADIIILTAGAKQKPGESRCELLARNTQIFQQIKQQLGELKPTALVLVVSNPVDILTHVCQQIFDLPARQIFGTGTLLDTFRMRWNVAEALQKRPQDITGYVLGEHGDAQFIAWSTVNVAAELSRDQRQTIELAVKEQAYRIIEGKGATYFGIAGCVVYILGRIWASKKEPMPISIGPKEAMCVGALATVSADGWQEAEMWLSPEEEAQWRAAREKLKNLYARCEWELA